MKRVVIVVMMFWIGGGAWGGQIPERWLERASGFEEGRELQSRHRVDMVLMITSRSPRGPARRSQDVENLIFRRAEMREFLADYVKVKLVIPGDRDTDELANERFRVQHGPRLFVIRPGGFATPISLFDRDGDRRTARSVEQIQEAIRDASSPRRTTP